MKESKFIRYMITGVVCAFFLMCELTLIKYCKTSMFFMRGEVIKLSLIAGIILIPFEKIGYSLYCKRILNNNILIGTSTIGLMSRHTWSIIIYILLALSIVLLSILSYITFRKNEKYIRAQIVFTAGIGFILMVLYDIFINTRGYIFDYTTDNVMIRNGVISCMLARGMMMLFAFIVLRVQYNSEPELSKIVIYDEIDFATQIYDEKAELLKKEYTNRIRLYRKSVENILKEKEKTEEQKE